MEFFEINAEEVLWKILSESDLGKKGYSFGLKK